MAGNMAAKVIVNGDYAYAPDSANGVQVVHIASITYLNEASRSVEENGTLPNLNDPVVMTFNKPLDDASKNGQTIVRENNIPIDHYSQVNGGQLALLPVSGSWTAGAEYNITIGGGIADIYQNTLGESLADGYLEWTFRVAP